MIPFQLLNSFLHILMYGYYGLSALGPHMQKYLWWKRYMTAIQMIQFVAIFVHSFQLLFRNCNYPRGFMWWIGFHAVLFWVLFYDFYKTAYNKCPKTNGSIEHQSKGNSLANDVKSANGHCITAKPTRNGVHKAGNSKKEA